jgi:hypothetical protein
VGSAHQEENTIRERSGLCPNIKKLLEKRKRDRENLPLSFGKKKVEQRKPVWSRLSVAFAAPCAPGVYGEREAGLRQFRKKRCKQKCSTWNI